MKNAFIIHSAEGTPQENWIPWLKSELENLSYKVIAPQFPTPEGQSLENWLKVFREYENEFNSETIIVAHSIGVAFALRILEHIKVKIGATFLIAGFIRGAGDEYDQMNKTFYNEPFDWEKIKSNGGGFFCFASDNDPNVPIDQTEEVATGVGSEIILVKGAGHFNAQAGYTQFSQLLEKIKSI